MKKIFIVLFTFIIASVSFLTAQDEYKFVNLGPNINSSSLTDCYPSYAPDGRTLYFSRQMNGDLEYEIYFTKLDENNQWTEAKPVSELNNSKRNTVFYITPDGGTMYIKGIYEDGGALEGFSMSTRGEGKWNTPVKINYEDESGITGGNNALTISSDNQTMIMSLPDGGTNSLYVSFRKGDNLWSKPAILPSNINTTDNEYSPFLASDNKTLYFSGGGHGGFGSNDIFKTVRQDDTWLTWSDPENLGELVNSSNWESFFTISAKGDKAIVYSLKEGNGDLFEVKLEEKNKPQPTLLLVGKVLDSKTGNPIEAKIYFEDIQTGKEIGTAITEQGTGLYKIVLTSGKKYGVYAKADGYIPVNENLDLLTITEYQEIEKNLSMVPIEVGQTVRINNLFFDSGKSEIKEESIPELSRLINLMQTNSKMVIKISGHTDDIGSDTDNITLSKNRADSVRNYLIKNGIDAARITAAGFGESKPVVKNDTDDNRKYNRRVEFTIVSN